MSVKFASSDVPELERPHFNGGEGSLFAKMIQRDEVRIMMRGVVPAGASIGLHTHSDTMEVVFVLSGKGRAIVDGVEESLEAGDVHYCPKGSSHTVRNDGPEDLVLCAVIPKV